MAPEIQDWLDSFSTLTAVVWIAFFILLGVGIYRAWPVLSKFVATVNALGDLPAFMKRTDDAIEILRHQVENDHETNLRDDVTELIEKVDALAQSDDKQWEVIELTLPRDARGRFIKKEE